jgi:hypothetical protein
MKPISIRIEKPCHEDWDKMSPTDTGRFCAACEKNVTDFTSMTDNEVLSFLENHTGKMCGQLRGTQLNRMIVHTKLQGKNYRLNAFFAALVFAGGAGSLSAQDTIPPAPRYTPTVIINEKHPTGPVCLNVPPKKEQLVLKASVYNTVSEEKVPYANVTLRGTNIIAEADDKGNFTMEIPDSLASDSITLMIYTPGYFREWVTIAPEDVKTTTVLNVAFNEIIMKGEMIMEE